MKIQVPYMVDMYVTVDLDTGKVTEARVMDTTAKFDDEWEGFWGEDDEQVTDHELKRKALNISDAADWPEWRIG